MFKRIKVLPVSSVFFAVACAGAGVVAACGGDDTAAAPDTSDRDGSTGTDADGSTRSTDDSSTGTDAGGGGGDSGSITLSIQEQNAAKSQSPLPALPPSPGNKYADNPAAAKLGQQLFF